MVGYSKFESEKFFIETMTRILRTKADYQVLYVNISKLKPKNRHPRFVRIVAKMLDNLVAVTSGSLFVFSNGDIVILGKSIDEKKVDDAVKKLRTALVTDPIWSDEISAQFAMLYNIDNFDKLLAYVGDLLLQEQDENLLEEKEGISAWQVEAVKNRLEEMNITDLVKHQSVLKLDASNNFVRMFDEFFVAVKDLRLEFDRHIDITANKWLFLYLTQILDKKTMASFFFSSLKNNKRKVSANLNLSTLFTPEFDDFLELLKEKGQNLVVEAQVMDVLNNPQMYFDAKELLHRQGHEILFDALSIEMLRTLNIKVFMPDYIKLFWHPLMEDFEQESSNIKEIVEEIGKDRFILAKTLNEKALRFGLKNGIRMFQGPYIDAFEVAYIQKKCPHAKECSFESCLKRKKLIAGVMRSQCKNEDILEGSFDG